MLPFSGQAAGSFQNGAAMAYSVAFSGQSAEPCEPPLKRLAVQVDTATAGAAIPSGSPISDPSATATLGATSSSSSGVTVYQPPVVGSVARRSLQDFVESFAKDPNTTTHTFDNTLNNVERKLIHQACLKWKLFSKSRGTGETRQLTISKTPLQGPGVHSVGSEASFDPQKEHLNAPLREWLQDPSRPPSLTLSGVSQEEMRYLYQLGTTFGFRPSVVGQQEGAVQCVRIAPGEEGKQFNYRTLFDNSVVEVSKLSSVLDTVQKPAPPRVETSLQPAVVNALRSAAQDPVCMALAAQAFKLGQPHPQTTVP
eukprot:RCo037481